ncbi:RNA polymerase sigma factor, sigma-70 family [Mycobacteroides abscessus subsp. massiliense]|nr:hypothetical protein [Mycobacteroides abscessus]SLC55222.1 RNA polymerase sigma factor, sigma-70 family [Mycobacteroides abscessus subsp. massiliense]MBE5502694.1 hypothetical protein [Mycobacteroides abscessus]SLH31116.1 RNA polymerase sigma factor, sigma-70 family [Mycobacteroides abscessus subsp. massiliense]SLH63236.1 RNA polymerase sigma factor, sigma-70 family [Mycobacteroides abscessus subsp. massiliense]
MLEPVGTAALADQLRNGDPEAFSKLLDLYGASMQRVARGYVSSSELAEDVVQETWIAVFKGIDKFEGRASLRTWIFTILINVAKKHGLAERRYTDTAVRVMTGGTVDPDRFRDAGDPLPGHWKEPPAPFPDTPEGSLLGGELTQVATARDCSACRRANVRWSLCVTYRGSVPRRYANCWTSARPTSGCYYIAAEPWFAKSWKTTLGRPHERRRDHLRATRGTGDRLPRRCARSRRPSQVRRTPAGM